MRTICLLLLCLAGCPAQNDGADAGDLPAVDALPSGACSTELPCRMGFCLGPGDFPGCGACRMPDPGDVCGKDEDCAAGGAGQICASAPSDCLCTPALTCRPGCTKDSCGEGQECGASRRCVGKNCIMDADCPRHFVCSSGKACERAACRTSGECEGGFCVGGKCREAPGRCMLPPP